MIDTLVSLATGVDHQNGHEGHHLEHGGTEEVLVVESPHPDDALVPVEILGGAALGGLLGLALVSGCNT